MESAIRLEGINKSFGKKEVLKDINIEVKKGTIFGIIGRNGAGKTTIMKIISGLSRPTAGVLEIKKNLKIGALIEEPGVCADMTGYDNLKLKALALGEVDDDKIEKLLSMVGLNKLKKLKVKNYSLGMKQRLGIALAIIGEPDILVLDEPINGLDPQGIKEIRKLITELRDKYGKTILISSHILEELFKMGDEYVIIDSGKVLMQASADDLKKKMEGDIKLITYDMISTQRVLEKIGLKSYEVQKDEIDIDKKAISIPELIKLLVENNIEIKEVSNRQITYEDLFFSLIENGKNSNGGWR